jgi:hypothetical protein
MKVKFSHIFIDHKGKNLGDEGNPLTLKSVSVECLMYPSQSEFGALSGQEKVKRHDLGVKILNNGDNSELAAEECSLLKKIIGDRQLPSVVAQSFALLDGKELPKYGA